MSAISNCEIGTGWFKEQVFNHLVKNHGCSIENLRADSILNNCIITPIKSPDPSTHPSSPKKKKSSDSKAQKASSPINPEKCQCRVWNHGYGGQCSFYKNGGTDFCKRHGAKPPGLGLITDDRPEICSTDGKVLKWIDISVKKVRSPPKTIKKTLEKDTSDYDDISVDSGSGVGDLPERSEPIEHESSQDDKGEQEPPTQVVPSDDENECEETPVVSDEEVDKEDDEEGETDPGNFDDFNLSDEDSDEE